MMCETLLAVALLSVADVSPAPAVAERTEKSQLENLLASWEVQSNRGDVIQIGFTRVVYDRVFRTEKRCTGRFIFAQGNRRADFCAIDYQPEDEPNRKRYKLANDRSETWLVNSKRIALVNHTTETVDVFPAVKRDHAPAVAEKERRQNLISALLDGWQRQIMTNITLFQSVPRYIRNPSQNLRRSFDIHVGAVSPTFSTLQLYPRGWPESSVWKRLDVRWDHKRGRVQAVKTVDRTGNLEAVYVINNYRVDPKLDRKTLGNPEYSDYSVQVHKAR